MLIENLIKTNIKLQNFYKIIANENTKIQLGRWNKKNTKFIQIK